MITNRLPSKFNLLHQFVDIDVKSRKSGGRQRVDEVYPTHPANSAAFS